MAAVTPDIVDTPNDEGVPVVSAVRSHVPDLGTERTLPSAGLELADALARTVPAGPAKDGENVLPGGIGQPPRQPRPIADARRLIDPGKPDLGPLILARHVQRAEQPVPKRRDGPEILVEMLRLQRMVAV